jgi:type IV fimbrial biogenesis protein FimT
MNKRSYGFTLIEIMVTLVVFAMLIMVGLPSMTTWLQNQQIKLSAEALQAGLQLARTEALRRNAPVQFSLVDTLTAACALTNTGTSWVVSLTNPSGQCDVAPSETALPFTIQKRSGTEGSPNAVIQALVVSSVTFNGLGRPTVFGGGMAQIDVSNPSGGACQPLGPMRCLRIAISNAGQVRMCDPMVADATDPRFC